MATAALDNWSPRHDSQKVDLAFVIDCTGSMGSYIRQAQKHISNIAETISRTAFNVHLALVEYRDHPPQDQTFVTNKHEFTSSVQEMKGRTFKLFVVSVMVYLLREPAFICQVQCR